LANPLLASFRHYVEQTILSSAAESQSRRVLKELNGVRTSLGEEYRSNTNSHANQHRPKSISQVHWNRCRPYCSPDRIGCSFIPPINTSLLMSMWSVRTSKPSSGWVPFALTPVMVFGGRRFGKLRSSSRKTRIYCWRHGMSISEAELKGATARNLSVSEDSLTVDLDDGRTIVVPLLWFPRLMNGTPAERANFRLIGNGSGIHWPDLDEDISIDSLLAGRRSGETQASLRRWLSSRERPSLP
jgi:hypothetical protein